MYWYKIAKKSTRRDGSNQRHDGDAPSRVIASKGIKMPWRVRGGPSQAEGAHPPRDRRFSPLAMDTTPFRWPTNW